jgi:regulator of replication initiation timing
MIPMDDTVAEQLEAMWGRLEWTEEHMKALESENEQLRTETEQLRAENEQLRAALADTHALAELAYNDANRSYIKRLLGW